MILRGLSGPEPQGPVRPSSTKAEELGSLQRDAFRRRDVDDTTIRFVDVGAQHRMVRDEIMEAWSRILDTGEFINGKPVAQFESGLSDYLGVRHAIGVGNGTDAITLALLACGVHPGDEVITPAHTFVATAEAVEAMGARPVLVDVDSETGTMDPAALEGAITQATRAVVPVHLYGQTADMDPILDIAEHHDLIVVEDAAQAIAANYRSRPAGSLGHAASFSFYPAKNLGACGDAGAVTTNDDAVADRLRMLRDHGQSAKSVHTLAGTNSRLDSLQAAALLAKLCHLDDWTQQRRSVAEQYAAGIETGVDLPTEAADRHHVYHLYSIRYERRDWLRSELSRRGIPTGIHYPNPVHLQPAFGHLGDGPGSFPQSEDWARRCLSLPMHAHMTAEHVEAVIAAVNDSGE